MFARIYRKATKFVAAGFLKALVKTVPYRVHTVLTDNGGQLVQHDKRSESGFVAHIFGAVCAANSIEHRQAKPHHPWSSKEQETIQSIVSPESGQAERMVRTIKDATVKSFHYASIADLRLHVRDWLLAYN